MRLRLRKRGMDRVRVASGVDTMLEREREREGKRQDAKARAKRRPKEN